MCQLTIGNQTCLIPDYELKTADRLPDYLVVLIPLAVLELVQDSAVEQEPLRC